MIPPCIETLPVRHRQLPDLRDHQDRMDQTRRAFDPATKPLLLGNAIQLPDWLDPNVTYKCRVTYSETIEKIEFEPYQPRPVRCLKLVVADEIDYTHKYADRRAINHLFAQRADADDMLMIRDGLLTDTSYANIALFSGSRWFTPARPMLPGTQRARLLRNGVLHPADIRPADLPQFQAIRLINAMLPWEDTADTAPISISHTAIQGLG